MEKTLLHPSSKQKSTYSVQFWLLSLSGFLFFCSFNMIIPELPSYLESMGGGEHKGLIIALFTITAGFSRPFSGKLADTWGRMPVMVLGVVASLTCSLMYPLISSVSTFLLLRLLHGLSTGFNPTGTSAYIADIIPANRRGEAMGIFGMCASTGMAFGPALGGYLATFTELNTIFYLSAFFSALSIIVLLGMKETLPNPQRFHPKLLHIQLYDAFDPRVWYPSAVMFFSVFGFGAVITLVPDFSEHLGIANKGLYMGVFTGSSLGIRILAGKVSDKYGRIPVMRVALLCLLAALLILANSDDQTTFFASAILFGMSSGMASPTIMAWTVDWSEPHSRGKALATMYIALEGGIGLGAYTAGLWYANEIENLPSAFTICVITAFVAEVLLWLPIRPPLLVEEEDAGRPTVGGGHGHPARS